MASSGTLSGIAVAAVGAGTLLVYAGIKGKSLLGEVQAVVAGKPPSAAAAASPVTSPSATTTAAGGYEVATGMPASQGSYTEAGLEKLWTDNGGPADTAAFAAQVAMAESSGNASATSANPDGGTNVGLWQLDTKGVGSGYPVQDLMDANLNCQITIMATGGGVNWQEWGDPVTAAVGYHYTP